MLFLVPVAEEGNVLGCQTLTGAELHTRWSSGCQILLLGRCAPVIISTPLWLQSRNKLLPFPSHNHQWILDFVSGARVSDVISPPRSKQKLVYVSLNYLVNMTIDSNLIPAAERTLLALQITNQAVATGRTVIFECFHDFFEKKIKGF